MEIAKQLNLFKVLFLKRLRLLKYDYRKEWLRLVETLSSADERYSLPEKVIVAAANLIKSPAGILLVVEDDLAVPIAAFGEDIPSGDFELQAPTDFLVENKWILDLEEAPPSQFPNPIGSSMQETLGSKRFVVPLILDKRLYALLALKKGSRVKRLGFEDIDLLRTAGQQLATHLAQYLAAQRLAASAKFEAYGQWTAFILHDLRNLIAQQSLLVRNLETHGQDPSFVQDAVTTVASCVDKMNDLVDQLSDRSAADSLPFDLSETVRDVVARCKVFSPRPELECNLVNARVAGQRDRFAFALMSLIRNAQEATDRSGAVQVRVTGVSDQAFIEVVDTGVGMSRAFVRERLFQPFESSKDGAGMGLGAYQLREVVRSMGGAVTVETNEGLGSTFQLRLPVVESR